MPQLTSKKSSKKKKDSVTENFIEVFSNWQAKLIFVLVAVVVGFIFFFFTSLEILAGNFSLTYMWAQIIIQGLITLLFALFVPISMHKMFYFNSFSFKENVASSTGTFLGILVAGCPACSITLASYLGLASVISLLPWYGLELKILAVPLLVYANYSLLKTLKVCKIKKKK